MPIRALCVPPSFRLVFNEHELPAAMAGFTNTYVPSSHHSRWYNGATLQEGRCMAVDAVSLGVFKNLLASAAEEMGVSP